MLALVRIRGKVNRNSKVEDTMKMLGLESVNTCAVVPEEPTYLGMVEKVRDYIAYGKVSYEVFLKMLKKRGRLLGDKRLDDESAKKLGFKGVDDFAKAVFEGKVRINQIEGVYKVFRLSPPSKGHISTKDHYPNGALGDWKDGIGKLLESMI